MIVAFDFDGVLDDERIQELCIKMRKEKNEIWVVTARRDSDFNINIMKPIMNKMCLSFSSVLFCNGKPKEEMLQMLKADIYIDNINNEFESILNHTNTIPFLFKN